MTEQPPSRSDDRAGLVAFMARNRVAANLLMLALILGGLASVTRIRQEVYPSFQLDIIDIEMGYPGSSPEEVEEGIVLPIEESIRGLDVVERITSTAREGHARVEVELVEGVDANRALQEVKNAVDGINFFPDFAERATVRLKQEQEEVMWFAVYGEELNREQVFDLAERVRRDLLASPEISQLEVMLGVGPEISVAIPEARLRALGLTLGDVADIIRDSARDFPGGSLRTGSGEVLLRTKERRDLAQQYGNIVLLSRPDGSKIYLHDVATIRDGFEDRPFEIRFNGGLGIFLRIYGTGDQRPLDMAQAVYDYLDRVRGELPEGVGIQITRDRAAEYRERLNLLMVNGIVGLLLVLLVLGAFLEPRLAFWVAAGIPTTIAGSLLLLPFLGASINMISLFAFIVTLGIVVDDAVIVGENVFYKIQRGVPRLKAAVEGAREMIIPVIFAVGTNIIAFLPLLFVPGETGRFFSPLPAVIIAVFLVSLIEALFVLPAHLGHGQPFRERGGLRAKIAAVQRRSSDWLDRFVEGRFRTLLEQSFGRRYLVASIFLAGLVVLGTYYATGRTKFSFSPVITSTRVDAEMQAPPGTSFPVTRKLALHIEEAGLRAGDRLGGREKVFTGRMNLIGREGEHTADINFYLISSNERDFTEDEFVRTWREEVGEQPALESLFFEYEEGPGAGAGMTVEISHPSREILEVAAADLANEFRAIAGVEDVDDGFRSGKLQVDVNLKPGGRALGLTPEDVGRQLRHAFYGAEALRFQRGRHELKVMVRLPPEERRSLNALERLIIRTPSGGEAQLAEIATLHTGKAYTEITRIDGQRTVEVRGNVVATVTSPGEVRGLLATQILPRLAADYPGLTYNFGGNQREERRAMDQLKVGLVVAGTFVFALLAALFRSYGQSLIVLSAIPFAIAAAFLGHLVLGYGLSVVSMFGMIALSGLVINGGLVLNQEINRLLEEDGLSLHDALIEASVRRFRPILLTSLTTFAGLAPMIFETSSQAQFLVPMAIALGFGTLLSVPVILILTPGLRLIAQDAAGALARLRGREGEPDEGRAGSAS